MLCVFIIAGGAMVIAQTNKRNKQPHFDGSGALICTCGNRITANKILTGNDQKAVINKGFDMGFDYERCSRCLISWRVFEKNSGEIVSFEALPSHVRAPKVKHHAHENECYQFVVNHGKTYIKRLECEEGKELPLYIYVPDLQKGWIINSGNYQRVELPKTTVNRGVKVDHYNNSIPNGIQIVNW